MFVASKNIQLTPGMVLYHRARYLHDKKHAYGQVTFIEEKDGMLYVRTYDGIKRFLKEDLGRYLFPDERSAREKTFVEGKAHLTEDELELFIRDEQDPEFRHEKSFFDGVVDRLQAYHGTVRNLISSAKMEASFPQELDTGEHVRTLKRLYEREEGAREMMAQPYFAKLELGQYPRSSVYIGNREVPGMDFIVSWQDPIASLYYLRNRRDSDAYHLKYIRNFDIVAGSFCGYYDRYPESVADRADRAAAIDDVSLEIIRKKRKALTFQDIVETIDPAQYELISLPEHAHVRVQGCAGSGKTVVLMHRISYLLFHNRSLKTDQFAVITPNRQLNLELSELARKQNIGGIKRYTMHEYYLELIRRYMSRYPISEKSRYYVRLKEALRNGGIRDFEGYRLNAIKSDHPRRFAEMLKSFREYDHFFAHARYFAGRELRHAHHAEFVREFEQHTAPLLPLLERGIRLGLFAGEKTVGREKANLRSRIRKAFRDFVELCVKYEIEPQRIPKSVRELEYFPFPLWLTDAQLQHLQKERRAIAGMADRLEQIEKLEEDIRFYLIRNIFPRYPVFALGGDTFAGDALDSQLLDRYMRKFNSEYRKVRYLKAFLEGRDFTYLLHVWEIYINGWKQAHGLERKIHAFEYYELLKLMHFHFRSLSAEPVYLFIDEGQDYAADQVELLRKVYPNACINIFGDLNQRIVEHADIYYFDQCAKDPDVKSYEIRLNYRNSVQITRHINEKCRLDMIPIGLNGPGVQILRPDMMVWKTYKGRKVVIVKDSDAFRKLLSLLPSREQERVRYNDYEFSDMHLNVLSVTHVKGLEFEEVLVFGEGMSPREYYVACSRALKKLVVLEAPGST